MFNPFYKITDNEEGSKSEIYRKGERTKTSVNPPQCDSCGVVSTVNASMYKNLKDSSDKSMDEFLQK